MPGMYSVVPPYKAEAFPVSDLHTLHVAQYGNASSQEVVVFIHGGPGGGIDDDDARYFNPDKYRVVLFDQRGAGKSTPASELKDNTTQHLIEDIEKIRKHLQVEKWHVFGGSWGSTLSLAYAQAHPEPVKSLTLRGIFTLRKEELDFFYQGPGSNFFFADYWDEYVSVIPEEERGDMMKAYYKRLTSDDAEVRSKAASAWSKWEMATCRLHVSDVEIKRAAEPGFADAFARIEAHYFVNSGFMREGQLLEKAEIDKIRKIDTFIVQGRYDVVCPFKTAWDLHKAFPEANFKICQDSGHSSKEPSIQDALKARMDSLVA